VIHRILDILAQATQPQHAHARWHLWMTIGELVLAAALGVLFHVILAGVGRRVFTHRGRLKFIDVLFEHLRAPAAFVWPLLFMVIARTRHRAAMLEANAGEPYPPLDHLLLLALIAALTWLVVRLAGAIEIYVKRRHDMEVPDNREARRVHTQVTVLSRSLQVVIVIAGVAAALMTFPRVQQIGASLLASAGIAGIVVGFAARPVLENLIAGLQIGFTQPIRLDDVVVIGGEQGRVEEIGMTYIVVRLWDDRRLIVPFSKFIGESFENWTRTSAQITGAVYLWVDYATPVERVRAAAQSIVAASPLWDQRQFSVQVTDSNDRAMQIRVVVSAAHSSAAWDLRVHVREKLIEFLQREIPEALPRRRVTLDRGADDSRDGEVERPGVRG
jgi:small-conductance mechanosensitive channel